MAGIRLLLTPSIFTAFVKEFNDRTAGGDMTIPVLMTVYEDRSFTFILKYIY